MLTIHRTLIVAFLLGQYFVLGQEQYEHTNTGRSGSLPAEKISFLKQQLKSNDPYARNLAHQLLREKGVNPINDDKLDKKSNTTRLASILSGRVGEHPKVDNSNNGSRNVLDNNDRQDVQEENGEIDNEFDGLQGENVPKWKTVDLSNNIKDKYSEQRGKESYANEGEMEHPVINKETHSNEEKVSNHPGTISSPDEKLEKEPQKDFKSKEEVESQNEQPVIGKETDLKNKEEKPDEEVNHSGATSGPAEKPEKEPQKDLKPKPKIKEETKIQNEHPVISKETDFNNIEEKLEEQVNHSGAASDPEENPEKDAQKDIKSKPEKIKEDTNPQNKHPVINKDTDLKNKEEKSDDQVNHPGVMSDSEENPEEDLKNDKDYSQANITKDTETQSEHSAISKDNDLNNNGEQPDEQLNHSGAISIPEENTKKEDTENLNEHLATNKETHLKNKEKQKDEHVNNPDTMSNSEETTDIAPGKPNPKPEVIKEEERKNANNKDYSHVPASGPKNEEENEPRESEQEENNVESPENEEEVSPQQQHVGKETTDELTNENIDENEQAYSGISNAESNSTSNHYLNDKKHDHGMEHETTSAPGQDENIESSDKSDKTIVQEESKATAAKSISQNNNQTHATATERYEEQVETNTRNTGKTVSPERPKTENSVSSVQPASTRDVTNLETTISSDIQHKISLPNIIKDTLPTSSIPKRTSSQGTTDAIDLASHGTQLPLETSLFHSSGEPKTTVSTADISDHDDIPEAAIPATEHQTDKTSTNELTPKEQTTFSPNAGYSHTKYRDQNSHATLIRNSDPTNIVYRTPSGTGLNHDGRDLEIVETGIDNMDVQMKEGGTPEHVTVPCSLSRHGDYYDGSSLVAAGVGGAFVGGCLVLAGFYCKLKFRKYLRGDYRRVPMEYDFELNPRLKTP